MKDTWKEPAQPDKYAEFYEYAVAIVGTKNNLQDDIANWLLFELEDPGQDEFAVAGRIGPGVLPDCVDGQVQLGTINVSVESGVGPEYTTQTDQQEATTTPVVTETTAVVESTPTDIMKTWDPPKLTGAERPADIAQTSIMLAIAYIMGRDFISDELTDNQQAAIDSGLELLHSELDTDGKPSLEEWMEQWEAAVEKGQSRISREEAERRYHKEHGE